MSEDVEKKEEGQDVNEPIPVWKQLGMDSEEELVNSFTESKFKMDALEQELAKKPKEVVYAPTADDIIKAINREKLDDDPDGAINEAVRSVLAKQKIPQIPPEQQQVKSDVASKEREMLDRTIKSVRAEAEKEGLDSGAVFGIMLDIAERKPFLSQTEGGVKEIGKQAMRKLRTLMKPDNTPPEHKDSGGSSSATLNRRGDGTPSPGSKTFEDEAKEKLMEAAEGGRPDDINKAVFEQYAKLLENFHNPKRR